MDLQPMANTLELTRACCTYREIENHSGIIFIEFFLLILDDIGRLIDSHLPCLRQNF
jgi:hypothetical protein